MLLRKKEGKLLTTGGGAYDFLIERMKFQLSN
jgi:hypothetical protein